ncbi:MAG TPA: MFS transporter, partial [Bryobacteraceae bacterium]|nr:MFS transporter [Bryobacteraceae bacterium]
MQAASPDKPSSSFLERLGMHPPLFWGFVAVLLMMCGCGIEVGFLSAYLNDRGFTQSAVALVFTVYGITATFAAWLAGALSDLWGPKRVMSLGVAIWLVFHAAFLLLGVAPGNYTLILLGYALRGFGYPLFAFGFLVWITVATPSKSLGTSLGWYWLA